MKKSLLALAVLGAYAGVASAQSSVTIFGVVDLSVNQIENGNLKTTSMQSNQLNSNRLGFRGYEDLGGGLGAGFWLEGGMTNENGTGGTRRGFNFARKSTVSLFSQRGGELRLGRDYVPTFSNLGAFDVFGANGLGQDTNLISAVSSPASTAGGAGTGVRANNTIAYHAPGNLGGFYGTAMYALGQGNDNNKYWGIRGGFATGPFDVALAYGETETTTANKFEDAEPGWFVELRFHEAVRPVPRGQARRPEGNLLGRRRRRSAGPRRVQVSAIADVSDKGTQGGVNIDNSDATQWALQYIYNLSKRTALYGGYAELDNDPGSSRSILNGTIGSNSGQPRSATGPVPP